MKNYLYQIFTTSLLGLLFFISVTSQNLANNAVFSNTTYNKTSQSQMPSHSQPLLHTLEKTAVLKHPGYGDTPDSTFSNKSNSKDCQSVRNFLVMAGFVFFIYMASRMIYFYKNKTLVQKRQSHSIEGHTNTKLSKQTRGHDLRTPLYLINEAIGRLREDLTTPQNHDPIVFAALHMEIQSHITHMNDIVSHNFSEKPYSKDHTACCQIKEQLEPFLNLFQLASTKTKIEYNITIEDVSVIINGHALKIIISNLVTNALRYTTDGGQVDIEIIVQDQNLHLTIKDTGIGIPKKLQYYIFNNGIRDAAARLMSETGKGQGLAIVAEQLALCEGRVSVTSKPGQGSTFHVILPCIPC